jgi:OOP family OmpA-OmpF porin
MKFSSAKLAKASGVLGLAALAAITSTHATAEDAGWYMGASGGPSQATIDDARISSSLVGGGFQSSTIADDNRSTGYKLFGGYQITPNFALEGGYFDLGKFGFTATTVPAGTLTGDIRVRGINVDAVGTLPLTEKFSVIGRIGVQRAEATDNFAGTGAVSVLNPSPNKRENNLKVGLGLQYAFTESLSLRTEIERYRINDAVGNRGDVDHVSVGLVYRFGAKAPEPVQVAAAAPVWVAPVVAVEPPPPAPVATPAPPPPAPVQLKKVAFEADTFFDFDKAAMKPSAKAELDKLAEELRGSNIDKVTVTGHTDRIGAHAYNVKLSTERAEAVKAYLVDTHSMAAEKIVTIGANGSEPVTKPGQCVGKKVTKALVSCLAPDRRVDIEVIGTK